MSHLYNRDAAIMQVLANIHSEWVILLFYGDVDGCQQPN